MWCGGTGRRDLVWIPERMNPNLTSTILQTCKSLYDASTTRPVYRKLANDLLRRCRALPLKGFQRLSDLSTENLIHSVNKATHYENAWRYRAPRPIAAEPWNNGINTRSNYMDVAPKGPLAVKVRKLGNTWYKIVSAPPGEEVDWLSPITSSYTLCATKSGKVVCWDVQTDTCLAEWNPGARWELWKCRVEFEERTVFFTMAKVLTGSCVLCLILFFSLCLLFDSYDDDRVMQFVLMRLTFSDGPSGESSPDPPIFSHVTEFRTTGVVMNVFLLDPSERLLSAFIWVSTSNTIGLYALPDWDKKEYVFIDTGIECVRRSSSHSYFRVSDCPSRSCHRIGLVSYTNNISSFIAKRVTRPTNISTLYPFSAPTPAHSPPKTQHLSSLDASHPLAPSRKNSSSLYLSKPTLNQMWMAISKAASQTVLYKNSHPLRISQ